MIAMPSVPGMARVIVVPSVPGMAPVIRMTCVVRMPCVIRATLTIINTCLATTIYVWFRSMPVVAVHAPHLHVRPCPA